MQLYDPSSPIRLLVRDTTLELHDGADQIRRNTYRVLGIWRRSGLTAAEMVDCILSARARAKRCYGVERRAAGILGELGARNRMPYMLAVLETLAREYPRD